MNDQLKTFKLKESLNFLMIEKEQLYKMVQKQCVLQWR